MMTNLHNYAVLNACNPLHIERESDVYVDFRGKNYFDGPKMVKKCVSWHSIPAAFETEFFVYGQQGWQGILKYDHILVMIKYDLPSLLPLVAKLRKMGKIIGFAYHENGNYFSNSAQNLNWLMQFKQLVDLGDYFWNLNMCLENFFQQLLKAHVFSSWHGLPHEWDHGFTIPWKEREGIMIGTRTLSQHLRRDTLYAIGIASKAAKKFDTHVTYFSEDSIVPLGLQSVFNQCGFTNVVVEKGPRSYEEWLQVIAPHRVLFHLDASQTLGQVVGDAMLLDVPSIGSETTNNKILYSDTNLVGSCKALTEKYKNPSFAWREFSEEFKELTSFEGLKKHHEENLFPCLK